MSYLPEGEEKLIQREDCTLRSLLHGDSIDGCQQCASRPNNHRVFEVDRMPYETCAVVVSDIGVMTSALGWDLGQQADASLQRERDISGSDLFSVCCIGINRTRRYIKAAIS